MFTAIGIDLGTTSSSVAVWQNGHVEIIANDHGNRATPSFVAFTDGTYLVGDAAKNQVVINPSNTVFDIKRLIGRRYEDDEIQEDMKLWPYRIINVCGKIMIEVRFKGSSQVFTPEEINAMLLAKMRETAEAYLGTSVRNAVITVPAYFNESQREATRVSGLMSGLNVLRILNEPTAAAIAYGLHKHIKGQKNVFIFDLGGGTFDVSILSIKEGSHFEVLASVGDSHLGGEDFDNRLMKHLIEEFQRRNNKNLSTNPKALYRLKLAVERAKRSLSSSTQTVLQIDALIDGIDAYFKITRAKFEVLCSDLIRKTSLAVQQALLDAKLDKSDIHHVVMVGGSTRIPKIRQVVHRYFPDKIQTDSVNQDEAVVCGAAIKAALLGGKTDSEINSIFLLEIAPLSLGIETAGGLMTKIIQRGVKVPHRVTRIFTTFTDNQVAVAVKIFQGERSMTKDNYLLGTFILTGIPLLPCGVPKIEVTFNLDINNILYVEGKETSTGITHNMQIINKYGGMMHRDVRRLVMEANKFKIQDENCKHKIEARNNLEKFIYQIKQAIIQYEGELKKCDRVKLQLECENCIIWLQEHHDSTTEEFETKYNQLLAMCEQCAKSRTS